MSSTEPISMTALERVLDEYQNQGRAAFLAHHKFDPAQRYFLEHRGVLFDAKAVVNAAYRYQHGSVPDQIIQGGERHANKLVRQLGLRIVDGRPTTVHGELAWRLAIWKHLQETEDTNRVPPRSLRGLSVYRGGQGIWVDVSRTSAISPGGVTMSVLHTGLHYPDDLGDESALYHYPNTHRPPGRDASEVDATKRTVQLKLPIFVISKPTPSSTVRTVRMAWVEDWEDKSEQFLISYRSAAPATGLGRDTSDDNPFLLEGNGRRHEERHVHVRPGQARFKLQVMQRYEPRCPLTGIEIPQMIEAAHLRPVQENGSNDPRNGIPLSASLHRAFDAQLFAFDPETLDVVTRADGPTAAQMHITRPHLRDLPKPPHREALAWRYNRWAARVKMD